jgi:hypothetical protein
MINMLDSNDMSLKIMSDPRRLGLATMPDPDA